MDEWADIFDQCKTVISGSDPSQGAQGQQADPRAFAGFMPGPGGAYTGLANGAFESVKSLNSEEAEDCMFGESDDEECHSSSNGGPQRLPFFGGIAEWPVKQMPHLPVRFCRFLCPLFSLLSLPPSVKSAWWSLLDAVTASVVGIAFGQDVPCASWQASLVHTPLIL